MVVAFSNMLLVTKVNHNRKWKTPFVNRSAGSPIIVNGKLRGKVTCEEGGDAQGPGTWPSHFEITNQFSLDHGRGQTILFIMMDAQRKPKRKWLCMCRRIAFLAYK